MSGRMRGWWWCCGVLSRELTVVLLIMLPQGRAAARLFLISVISHTQLIKPVAPHPTPTTPAATTPAPAATTLTAVNMLQSHMSAKISRLALLLRSCIYS